MNVFYEPYIPTDMGMLSIVDCVRLANKIKEIRYPKLPIFEFSLYNFLIAVVMDAYKITDVDLEDLADEGEFQSGILEEYIRKYVAEGFSFDMYDEETPFLQTPIGMFKDGRKPDTLAVLNPSYLTGHNPIFYGKPISGYEKKNVQDRYEMDDAELFACLIFNQMSPVFAGAGYSPCLGGCAAGTPISVLYKGNNLFETILLNMPSMKKEEYEHALPLWRNKAGYIQDPLTHPQDILSISMYPAAKLLITKDRRLLKEAVRYKDSAMKDAKEVTNRLFAEKARHLILDKKKDSVYPVTANENTPVWMLLAKLNPEKITGNELAIIEDAGLRGILKQKDLHVSIYIYQLVSKQKKFSISCRQDFFMSPHVLTIENQEALRKITDFLSAATKDLQSVMSDYRGYALEYSKVFSKSVVKNSGSLELDLVKNFIGYEGDRFVGQTIQQVVEKTVTIEDALEQIKRNCLDVFRSLPVIRNDHYTKSRYTMALEKRLVKTMKTFMEPPKENMEKEESE